VVGVLTAAVGFLMIANFPYYSFKGIDFRGRVPFVVMIAVIFIFGLITVDPSTVLLASFLIYAISGPVQQLLKRPGKGRG
jgi:CDP-diacylglycerol--serine O-phosphatidyltransferase